MNNKTLIISLIGCVCFIIYLLVNCHQLNSKYQSSLEDVFLLGRENRKLQTRIDEQGRQISGAQNIILTQSKEIEKHLSEIEEIKRLEQKVVFTTETKYEKLTIPIHDTTYIVGTDTTIQRQISYSDEWLRIDGKLEEQNIIFDSIAVYNKYTLEFGIAKSGIFHKKVKMVYIRNENPYTLTKEVTSFKLEQQPKWYQRDVWKFVGGGLAAFLLIR